MEVLHPRCAGLDVHKDVIVVCRRQVTAGGAVRKEVRSFGATTRALLELAAWVREWEITEVVMESTGVYWIPVWNVLEDHGFKLTLVNPQHIKNVPGRKSDVKDSEWLAKLLAHGMVRASFIPPAPQRELRELVRTLRSFVEDRTQQIQRMQKILQSCNIKLDSALSDITGESGQRILEAILDGESDPDKLAGLATRRIRASRDELAEALQGRLNDHGRFLLRLHLDTFKDLQAKIGRLEAQIDAAITASPPFAEALALLQTIPGVGLGVARTILAEVGVDMSRFPTAGHLVSWAGLCPRLDESAGKVRSRKVRVGNRHLKTVLCQGVLAGLRCKKKNYLQALYHRIKARRDGRKATIAVAASILTSVHAMLTKSQSWRDLGNQYFLKRDPQRVVARLARQARELGFELQPTAA